MCDVVQVLEGVVWLNLAHNRLHSLDGITAFVAVAMLDLSYNLVSTRKDLVRLTGLCQLHCLQLEGLSVGLSVSLSLCQSVCLCQLHCLQLEGVSVCLSLCLSVCYLLPIEGGIVLYMYMYMYNTCMYICTCTSVQSLHCLWHCTPDSFPACNMNLYMYM